MTNNHDTNELATVRAKVFGTDEERREVIREHADEVRAIAEDARADGRDDVADTIEAVLADVVGVEA